jgi:hypothetical protein
MRGKMVMTSTRSDAHMGRSPPAAYFAARFAFRIRLAAVWLTCAPF